MVIRGQKTDSDEYGMVAACVVNSDGNEVYGINHRSDGGKRIHAERDAINRYEERHGKLPKGSIVVTTLSPCNTSNYPNHPDRYGKDCQELLDSRGVKFVYCGYKNPEENPDPSIETGNPKIKKLCKAFADTFLEPDQLDELDFLGSPCTKDCSGHRAGYAWSKQKQRVPNSHSQSFNNGAALQAAGK
jgi:pyrimidine deaminase RibD-like protein